MSNFLLYRDNLDVCIPEVEDVENIAFYKIQVIVGKSHWFVKRRYTEFDRLHRILVENHGLSKNLLPTKRITFRSQDESSLNMRREALESYCKRVLNFMRRTMPWDIVEFFEFDKYDLFFIVQRLAAKFSADIYLVNPTDNEMFSFSLIELHAIGDITKSAFPKSEIFEIRYDPIIAIEACAEMRKLIISGDRRSCFLHSNINQHELQLDFTPFKVLERLILKEMTVDNIKCLGNLRDTLERLDVSYTCLRHISDIILCDAVHKDTLRPEQKWTRLTYLNLSENKILGIDPSITLLVNLETLILDYNRISNIPDLTSLCYLTHLSLVHNRITGCSKLHTKLGNIKSINLSDNGVFSLNGFSRLYSLVSLNLKCNKISRLEEITFLDNLPYLEQIEFAGCPISNIVDYRIKVFERLKRPRSILLDNEKPTEEEMNKAILGRTLDFVRQGGVPDVNNILTIDDDDDM